MKPSALYPLVILFLGAMLMNSINCDASPDKGGKKQSAAAPAGAKKQASSADELTPDVKALLLKLARQNLEAAVKGQPPVAPSDTPGITRELRGCFVTLTKKGQLRGCIGYIEGIKPLFEAVMDNAKNAALEDPRFPQVRPAELADIKVEVSVLTKPVPLDYKTPEDLLAKLVPGEDGIILTKGYHQSTFLPQVWGQLPDKTEFLEHLSQKGGMPPDGWKTAEVKRYRAVHFEEQ
jgi:AmmeMemoRadiSam system protein A